MQAGRDLWGEAAMAQHNGASYEFFAPLLAPSRYVNADFRCFPKLGREGAPGDITTRNDPLGAKLANCHFGESGGGVTAARVFGH